MKIFIITIGVILLLTGLVLTGIIAGRVSYHMQGHTRAYDLERELSARHVRAYGR